MMNVSEADESETLAGEQKRIKMEVMRIYYSEQKSKQGEHSKDEINQETKVKVQ